MISGIMLRDAVISASNNINNNRKSVDELNIFPVPDGDTGTNMSMTALAAARELALIDDANTAIGEVASKAAAAMLRGARGNSGVILSLIFRGIAKGLKEKKDADASDLAAALTAGVESAYNAVMKPTEGTILTVIRIAAESARAQAQEDGDPIALWRCVCDAAQQALENTPNQLPVLKASGVVDAGGQGLVLILRGMLSVFEDNTIIPSDGTSPTPGGSTGPKEVVAQASDDIKYGYCSEFLINRDKNNTRNPLSLRAYLESIGDCVVVVDDGDIIKVHVHSNEPGNVIQAALNYGQLTNIKIDNMRWQHTNAGIIEDHPGNDEPEKEYGFVAVAAGDGLAGIFTELGANQVVSGGQTMNPSTDDILSAIQRVHAKHVFVLPNNKNIIMAAEQAIPLSKKKVSVLHTKTIPQGIAALLAFDGELSGDENHIAMMRAAEQVQTGQITFAVRDSEVEGTAVKEGEILGLENGKITVVDHDTVHAAIRVTRHLLKKSESGVITVYYGADVDDQTVKRLEDSFQEKFGEDAEISVLNGGQPIYYFLISVE